MEPFFLLVVAALVAIVALPFIVLAKAGAARRETDELRSRVAALEHEVRLLRQPPNLTQDVPRQAEKEAPARERTFRQPLPRRSIPSSPPEPIPVEPPAPQKEPEPPLPPVDWEQFMGAKLFAWIGGLALFLGIAFFVKYSFEHNLIPPEARVAIGFIAGLGLIAGGLLMRRKENAVTAQTLCATGILVLYAVTYACRSYYHFPFFSTVPTLSSWRLSLARRFFWRFAWMRPWWQCWASQADF